MNLSVFTLRQYFIVSVLQTETIQFFVREDLTGRNIWVNKIYEGCFF